MIMTVNLNHCMFVYGALKQGQPNNGLLTNRKSVNIESVSKAVTEKRLPIVITGKDNIPCFLYVPGRGHVVIILCLRNVLIYSH